MASFLRQLVAGPRARHAESDLDLCYVTDRIIATSGPSQTYPQRAYRNPLDRLVTFLDKKHGEDWAIWEFRAEGTGYPDDAVHGRVRHYPWPDHHPPPFRLMPNILASMKNWLEGGELHGESDSVERQAGAEETSKKRVVVVHCKAGKGRSGTVSCSYLVAEEGWTAEDALERFTQRRMRPQFGAGVSIPSQLRWVGYVDRWAKSGRQYIDRPVEIVEIHVWGLHHGVKLSVEGFVDQGKKIRSFHTFKKAERVVVEGGAPEGGGLSDMIWEMAGYGVNPKEKVPEEAELSEAANDERKDADETKKTKTHTLNQAKRRGTDLIKMASSLNVGNSLDKSKSKTISSAQPATDKAKAQDNSASKTSLSSTTSTSSSSSSNNESEPEPGGMAVIMKPTEPIELPTSDVMISSERRSSKRKRMGLTMVTAVAHVWFNAFFEGTDDTDSESGEGARKPSDSGVFAIEWEAMDGIKGTSRKGARAFDRIAVVWRVAGTGTPVGTEAAGATTTTAGPVPEARPADWTGVTQSETKEKGLGLRVQSPDSGEASRDVSVKGFETGGGGGGRTKTEAETDDGASLEGVKSSGPTGGVLYDDGNGDGKDDGKDDGKGK